MKKVDDELSSVGSSKMSVLKSDIVLYILIVINIVFSAISNTLWYRLTLKSMNYSYLYGQFYVTILFAGLMIPIYLLYVCYRKCYQRESIFNFDIRSPKIKAYIIFSILETLIGYIAVLPSLYFSPVFLILFGQSSIILNHIGSYFYFKRTYTKAQIFSIFIILFAVVLATITESGKYAITNTEMPINDTNNDYDFDNVDEMVNNSTTTWINIGNVTKTSQGDSNFGTKAYILLFLMACIVRLIAAFSNLYKEKKYKDLSLSAIETLTCVSVLEAPMSLFVFVFLFLPLPPPAIHVPLNNLGGYIKNGTILLFFSEDKEMFWIMIIFLILSAVSSGIDFIITQKLNSTINVITGVATLSLSILFVGIEFLAGAAYRQVTFYEYMALILIIMAIINYRIGTKNEEKKILDENGVEVLASQVLRRIGQSTIVINAMIPKKKQISSAYDDHFEDSYDGNHEDYSAEDMNLLQKAQVTMDDKPNTDNIQLGDEN